jgi:hypothetical protein
MADTTMTGAATDVQVNNAATAAVSETRKKLIIKIALVVLGALVIYWLYKKIK